MKGIGIMEKKYEFTGSVMRIDGHYVKQIVAIRSFGEIKKGVKGGYIQSEDNLSHDGDCWVYPDGVVAEHAVVQDNAKVYSGIVFNSAVIKDNANIGRTHCKFGKPRVCGAAVVCDNASVHDNAFVSDFAVLSESATVSDYARVEGNARMSGDAHAFHYACVFGNAKLQDNTFICGHVKIGGNTTLIERCCITNDSVLLGDSVFSEHPHQKYRLLDNDTIVVDGRVLYRIVAIEDGPFCHYGEKGGYVESEKNLSQHGSAWIKYPAYAYGDTIIHHDMLLKAN